MRRDPKSARAVRDARCSIITRVKKFPPQLDEINYWASLSRDVASAKSANDEIACDEAFELVNGPQAEEFARALDVLGWMIVEQPKEFFNSSRWPMDRKYGRVPPWAEDNEGSPVYSLH